MPAGRPSAMTVEVRRKVLDAIKLGNYREVAAQYAGITRKTLQNYLKRKSDPEAVEFLRAILEAEAAVEIKLVGVINKLANGDLKAATWYLSHKFAARWADNTKEVREALKLLRQLTGAKSNG